MSVGLPSAAVNNEDVVPVAFDVVPALAVPHGFTSRSAGDLAARPADWRRVVAGLGPALQVADVALLSQVHGATVARVRSADGPDQAVAQADAAFTTEAGIVLAVRTADCVPVLVSGPGVVAVAHAGWRGAASDIVGALVARLRGELGVQPAQLVAAIGPAISGTAYEVGEEVVEGLRASGLPDAAFLGSRPGRPHVDLPSAVAAQLRRTGVTQVHVVRRCTYADPGLYSYRRDAAAAGRQAGVIVGAW